MSSSSKLRMTGLISGLDTESIISALVSTRKIKVDKTKGEQTKHSWKQEIWKDLNKDLKSLQSTVSSLRYSTAFAKKTTAVSDTSKVSVISSDSAPVSVQSLKVESLAKTAYLTGSTVAAKGEDGKATEATALTTLKDLGFSGSGSFKVSGSDKTIDVDESTTISDVLSKLQKEGLNASFDSANQRIFVSAKNSGEKANFNLEAVDADGATALAKLGLGSDAKKIDGTDAKITLNGAEFSSSTNVFSVNGLTITAMGKTAENEEITLTTKQDTSGIYDMLKGFVKKYNEIIKKLDTFYNAESAKKMEPLTDEEKDALSETEAEKYEQKIKDSLLKGDDTVNSVASALKEIMSSGIKVGDKKMYLSDFGIKTLDYFASDANEKYVLHIDGDADDEKSSGNEDKLKAMISANPDDVISFFTQLSNSLYLKMNDLSSSVNGYRSFGNFYNDKKMATEYTDYTTKITSLEEKMNAYEDKLYKQYAAMEKSLAKMQSNSSAVTGLLGMKN